MIHELFTVALILLAETSVSRGQLPSSVCVFFKTADCTQFKPRLICASDGTSFPNECAFSKAHCNDPSLQVIYDGKECFATHPTTSHPVTHNQLGTTVPSLDLGCNITNHLNCNDFALRLMCASDGKTYRTDCDFAKAHCKDNSLTVITFGQECSPTTSSSTSTVTSTSGTALSTSTTITSATPATSKTATTNTITSTTPTTTKESTTQKTSLATPTTTLATSTTRKKSTTEATALATPTTTKESITQTDTSTTKAATTKSIITPTPKSSFDLICRLLMSAECNNGLNVVCSTHGNYRNTCEYQKAKCLNPTIHNIHNGFCSPGEAYLDNPSPYEIACQAVLKVTCLNEGPPMCDNDGQTYTNFCELEKAKCRIHGIELAPCPS